ncbi:uncharacterized protein LOC127792803 isoform X2 [Diospyros lotus]|uniref:uncharacterized protein LOC127792803 isoform X2 n=1 Tax=Diospyros lotus TaxID=55363 RepID=UPI0022514B99|nr:uncharacterized protein LOC127792803 isoform X2 [Diospyros lotus]
MAANQPNDGQRSPAEVTATYKDQLIDVITNMKSVAQPDPQQARKILVHNPMLARYLLLVNSSEFSTHAESSRAPDGGTQLPGAPWLAPLRWSWAVSLLTRMVDW